MKDMNYYRAIHGTTNTKSRKEAEIIEQYRYLADSFEKPIDNEKFYLWNCAECEPYLKIPLQIVKEEVSTANGDLLTVKTLYENPVVIGDVIYRVDCDEYYLCNQSKIESKLFYTCKLVRCNYTLKWQDSNKNIFEYPVFEINSTQYNSGEAGDKTVTLGSAQHLITIASDKNTILLDHGKRFFFDKNKENPTVFTLTQNDTTSYNYDKGLLKLTVTEGQYNPETDSIENWLCDYKENSTHTFPINYEGKPTIRTGGKKSVNIDTTLSILWEVESEVGAEIEPLANTAVVKCPFDTKSINKIITVKALVDGKHPAELTLTVNGGV